MSESYGQLRKILREIGTLQSVGALLSWDQETMMPPAAGAFRAEELALISTLVHRRLTDARVGDLIAACEADRELMADPAEAANIREIRHDHDRARKLPPELVAELSETSSLALEAWKRARGDSDFKAFEPWLRKQVELNGRKAECYGVPDGGELYDALLEDYEPGMRAARLEEVFRPLREALTPLIAELAGSGRQPDLSPCRLPLPVPAQKELNRTVAERVGYDFGAGRLDVSTHPFTNGLAPGDTRITTRYGETQFVDALSSTLHEAGHGLYEQGLPKKERPGEPLGTASGLGIHESQSRLWENHVGRSLAFWQWVLPLARKVFGPALDPYSPDDFYRAVNAVRPHLIRVESDEATYNLHIMIRFDIERALMQDDLPVGDVPGLWNDRMKRDLGLDVPDDRRGCLQDIHWSLGSIGYFPTYTLGTIYAAQLWEAATSELDDLDGAVSRGEFGALLGWLREKIHRHGRRYAAEELCVRATGSSLDHRPLIRYLENKLRSVYEGPAGVTG